MASRGITVKLPKDKVIKSLEERLKEYNNIKDNYPKLKEAQERKQEAYKKAIFAAAKKQIAKGEGWTWSDNDYGSTGVRVTFTFKPDLLPPKPEKEDIKNPDNYQFREDYADLEQSIRLLKMSDDEYVSTSTYRTITRFL